MKFSLESVMVRVKNNSQNQSQNQTDFDTIVIDDKIKQIKIYCELIHAKLTLGLIISMLTRLESEYDSYKIIDEDSHVVVRLDENKVRINGVVNNQNLDMLIEFNGISKLDVRDVIFYNSKVEQGKNPFSYINASIQEKRINVFKIINEQIMITDFITNDNSVIKALFTSIQRSDGTIYRTIDPTVLLENILAYPLKSSVRCIKTTRDQLFFNFTNISQYESTNSTKSSTILINNHPTNYYLWENSKNWVNPININFERSLLNNSVLNNLFIDSSKFLSGLLLNFSLYATRQNNLDLITTFSIDKQELIDTYADKIKSYILPYIIIDVSPIVTIPTTTYDTSEHNSTSPFDSTHNNASDINTNDSEYDSVSNHDNVSNINTGDSEYDGVSDVNTGNMSDINTGYDSVSQSSPLTDLQSDNTSEYNTGDLNTGVNTGDLNTDDFNTGYNTGLNTGDFNTGFNTGDLNTGLNTGFNTGDLNTGFNSGFNTGFNTGIGSINVNSNTFSIRSNVKNKFFTISIPKNTFITDSLFDIVSARSLKSFKLSRGGFNQYELNQLTSEQIQNVLLHIDDLIDKTNLDSNFTYKKLDILCNKTINLNFIKPPVIDVEFCFNVEN